jgi:hypothetical protein
LFGGQTAARSLFLDVGLKKQQIEPAIRQVLLLEAGCLGTCPLRCTGK